MNVTVIKRDNTIRVEQRSVNVKISLSGRGPQGPQGDPATNLVTSVAGKQGIVTLNRSDVGLGNVDNTSDTSKPVSTATQAAINAETTRAQTAEATKATDSAVVHNTGNETIAGTKTFIAAPTVPSGSFPESAVTNLTTDLAAKYVKPGTGIPETDLASALQTKVDGAEQIVNKGAANGYASLDSSGKITSAELPALALTDTYVVSSQVAMLALSAHLGDVAVRTDLSETFILTTSDPTQLANWQQILTPAAPVQSVAGRTGNIVLAESDINSLVSDLAAKAPLNSPALIGTPTAPTATTGTNTTQLATTAYVEGEIVANATPDATTSTKGKIQLAGDLGGTAAGPTTPTAVHLAGTETITGSKTFLLGTLLDKGNQLFNVKAYGAKGDGVTDDTAAIQAAISAAVNGGIIYLPTGIYLVSNTLSIVVSGTILMGAGQVSGKEGNVATKGTVIVASPSFPGHKPIFIGGTPSTVNLYLGISVYGINFELGTASGAYADGLYFFNNDQGVCEEVFVDYPYASGIWMGCVVNLGNGGVDSGHIVHCKVAGAFNNTVTFIDDASGSHTFGGTALEFGPYMYYGTMEGSSGIGCLGNTFGIGDPNNASGNHNKLIGCEADGAGVDGFYVAGARSTLIGCSSFSPTGHNALHFFAADGTVAFGCSFAGSNANNNQVGSAGAVVFNDSSRGVIFTSNQIFDNPHGYPTAAIWENGVNTGVGCIYSNNLLEPSGDNDVFGTNIVLSAGTTSRAYDNHGFNSAVTLTTNSNLTPVANTYIVNTSSATRQALPDATLTPDLRMAIKNIGTGQVSIGTAAPGGTHPGQTIDGVDYSYSFSGYRLNQNESVNLVSDGSNWKVIEFYSQQAKTLLPGAAYTVQLGVPLSVAASLASGGSLTVGTPYYYVITALDYANGETVISAEVTITPNSGNQTASLTWGTPPGGAISDNVYRTTTSGQYYLTNTKLANVSTTSYSDTGSSTITGTPPLFTTAYQTTLSNALRLGSTGSVLYLGQTNSSYAVIDRGQVSTGTSTDLYIGEANDTGHLYIRGTNGITLSNGPLNINAQNIVTDGTTGTKIGTATNQKIAFYNSAPIVQPTGDIITALQNLGLIASATLSESDVTSLVSDLALKAPLASPTFSGTVILPNSTVTNAMLAGSIAASKLVGTDITTVGTITAGTWNGTTIAVGNGGTGTGTAFTAGSVVFAGASGVYSQNNSKLFWDNTNNRLGLGTASPLYQLDVSGSSPSIYLRYPSFAASSALLLASGYNLSVQYNTGTDSSPTWVDGLKVGLNSSGIGAGKVSIPTANASLFLGATNSGYFIIERGQTAGGSSTDLYIGENADTGNLYIRGTKGITLTGTGAGITPADGGNIVLGTSTGTKIGTATTQKLAFYNSAPIIQPSATGISAGFTATTGTAVLSASTFTGNTGSTAYTIGDIVNALKLLGLLAA